MSPRHVSRIGILLLLLVIYAGTACQPAGGDLPPREAFVTLRVTGGIAARDQTTVIRGDGSVEITGQPARSLSGGLGAARALQERLLATGVFEVAPGDYLPADPCCDRFTYELTLVRAGKSYRYVTMDATETAPKPIFAALTAVQETVRGAQ
jgi:hypothetical protein